MVIEDSQVNIFPDLSSITLKKKEKPYSPYRRFIGFRDFVLMAVTV